MDRFNIKTENYRGIFNKRILGLLNNQATSQRQLALKLGMDPRTLNHAVTGKCKVTPDKLINIADHFDCSVDYLLGRAHEAEGQQSKAEIKALKAQVKTSQNEIAALKQEFERSRKILDCLMIKDQQIARLEHSRTST